MTRAHTSETRDQRGSALVEFCWVGLILFIPIAWIVLAVFEVQRGTFALGGAARAAARAYALAPDDATGAARAQAVVDRTLADQGVKGQMGTTKVTCQPLPANCHVGTSVITVTVHSGVSIPFLPAMLSEEQRSFALSASHTVPIGQFVAIPDDASGQGSDQ